MITVREWKLRAMVALDWSAHKDAVRRLVDGTRPQCVVQPRDGTWFPASISVRWSQSQGRPVRAVVRVWLLAGEPEAFLATGQPFAVWADAIVDDHTVRGDGRLGDGVIVSQESAASEAPPAARTALPYRRTVPQPRLAPGASVNGRATMTQRHTGSSGEPTGSDLTHR